MKIVMIGAGNVATNIAKTLADMGETPVQIWSRTLVSAETLAKAIGAWATSDWESVVKDADIYIVAVKDDAMLNVIDLLCAHCKHGVFVHTAGTMSMSLFTGKAEHYGVLYPMQTFSKQREVDFSIIPCFIEANDEFALKQIEGLAGQISHRVYQLSSEDRKYLHLSAVFACNFANHCYAASQELLQQHGIPFDVMLPLIDETAAKVHGMTPKEAQTGPAVRYDENVIGKQIRLLENQPYFQKIYDCMSKSIHELESEN